MCNIERWTFVVNNKHFWNYSSCSCKVGDKVEFTADVSFTTSEKGKYAYLGVVLEGLNGEEYYYSEYNPMPKITGNVESYVARIPSSVVKDYMGNSMVVDRIVLAMWDDSQGNTYYSSCSKVF